MKILGISDIHGKEYEGLYSYLEKNDIDLIIVSGDITNFGPLEFVEEFFNKLSSYDSTIVAIPGNCDPEGVVERIDQSPAICVHEDVIDFDNLVIYGFGGSNPTPFDTPREFDEETLYNSIKSVMESKNIDSVKETTDNFPYGKISILVTHAPPKDTETDKIADGGHVGSWGVRKIIEEYQPRLNFCGHIHESRGFDMIDNTIIVNPGMLEDGYGSLIEIDNNNNIIANFVELK
ncbi:metallophosphoesterase family protein [Methanobrevibacter sp. TMH8]|uniref:metallophosphoesterase family protein n=1 Tax=Methanobrevibacter sp. TMH8 TaxID=2848611 RepID=UPI001CCE42F2|nr:metallophosphoesterase [Methanobrevibacter sp. TMH8]MBZ9571638.1 metallophosphoesterase family protein [Methanobrevibacter sp. TMH8]